MHKVLSAENWAFFKHYLENLDAFSHGFGIASHASDLVENPATVLDGDVSRKSVL